MPATPEIVADRIQLTEAPDSTTLSCRIRGTVQDLPESLWFSTSCEPAACGVSADPFVPVLLLAAMRRRARLIVEGDVSAALLAGIPRAAGIMAEWARRETPGLGPVPVSARAAVRVRTGQGAGAFFSGGADSFFTALRNHRRYPPGDSRRIGTLVLVHGFDVVLGLRELFQRVEQDVRAFTAILGTRVVIVRTNTRDVLVHLDWGRYSHGPALAAVGLLFEPSLHTVFIPATDDFTALKPRGSHPALDPLWSTEATEFVHDGGEVTRAEKIALIAQHPDALRCLRVCWENRGGAYNCGRCEKCLRTMVELDLLGVLDGAPQFPPRVEASAIAELAPSVDTLDFWRESLRRAREIGGKSALVAALEDAVARGEWKLSRLGAVDATVSRIFRRAGFEAASVKALDQRWLGGGGMRLFRKVQHLARRG